MKKKYFIFCLLVLFISIGVAKTIYNQKKESKKKTVSDLSTAPIMTFEREVFNFGAIEQGKRVVYDFKFRNTGKRPLILEDVMASCGCTSVKYPKKPILPNQTGRIHVVFDTEGKQGKQYNVICILNNTNSIINNIYLKGKVNNL